MPGGKPECHGDLGSPCRPGSLRYLNNKGANAWRVFAPDLPLVQAGAFPPRVLDPCLIERFMQRPGPVDQIVFRAAAYPQQLIL